LCFCDFRDTKTPKAKKNPLFNAQPLLDELNHQAKKMWTTSKWVSIDEQTLGFKGRHGLKLRILYKREGDGFQCDAVCDRGYTYSFYFRHGDAPDLPEEFKKFKLSPTARRVVWLALRLPNLWTRIYMDNLFNSRKLYSALHMANALTHGVARTTGRGIPPSVVQKEEKNEGKAEKLRGLTQAAVLSNDLQCPNLIACSVYDTKPVHFLSGAAESVHWIEKKRKVWSDIHQEMKLVGFMRLNLVNDYNNNMNSTDIADQLRGVYRPDHWMRNRKWWWAFFIWSIGVAATNSWLMYENMYECEKRKKGRGLPPKWTHCEFLVELVYDFMFPSSARFHVEQLMEMDDNSFKLRARTSRSFSAFGCASVSVSGDDDSWDLTTQSGKMEYLEEIKQSRLNKSRLESGYFACRFDGLRHASLPTPGPDHC